FSNVNRGSGASTEPARARDTTKREAQTSVTEGLGEASVRNKSSDIGRLSWIAWAASIRWILVAASVYAGVALLLLLRMFIGLGLARRLVRSSKPIHAPRVVAWLSARANLLGRPLVPVTRESELVCAPLTIGMFSPTILLPSAWREWDDAKLDAVLTHEISHVARWDCLTQYLALFHRATFWFSPLAWWLNRQITELAEQASDEAVLSGGAERNQYARTLLGFLEAVHAGSGRIHWQGVSMASSDQAEKRLERILTWRGDKSM